MSSHIRDINLWESGALKIQWVRDHMPLLAGIEKDFIETKPFAGMKVALSVHMEAKTARLCLCLAAGGADMYATGCNPLSTQDDVAAALVHAGLNVFAVHGATMDEYEEDLFVSAHALQGAEIRDLTGKLVLKAKAEHDDLRLDLTSLPTGMYFVTTFTAHGISTHKLMKR